MFIRRPARIILKMLCCTSRALAQTQQVWAIIVGLLRRGTLEVSISKINISSCKGIRDGDNRTRGAQVWSIDRHQFDRGRGVPIAKASGSKQQLHDFAARVGILSHLRASRLSLNRKLLKLFHFHNIVRKIEDHNLPGNRVSWFRRRKSWDNTAIPAADASPPS